MTIRLNKVTRDLNVGITTAVEFLQKKGFTVEANPNTKITDEQFEMLKKEFSNDKDLKIKSERFSQERHSSKERNKAAARHAAHENNDAPNSGKEKMEEIKTVLPEDKLPKFKVLGKIDLNNPQLAPKPAEPASKPEPAEVEEPAIAPEPEPAPTPAPAPANEEPEQVTEPEPEQPATAPAENRQPEEPANAPAENASQTTTDTEETVKEEETEEQPVSQQPKEEIFKIHHEGLGTKINIIGQIDLAALNQSTRPRKKTKEEKRREREEKEKQRQDQRKQMKEAIMKEIRRDDKSKEGGKDSDGNSKKKRTRIGKEKVDINNVSNFPKGGGASEHGKNSGGKEAQGGGKKNKERFKKPVIKQEVSEEDVAKQVKETLARLTAKGKNKTAKYRKEKREQDAERRQELENQEQAESKVLKLTEFVTANELASMMNVPVTQVISTCMSVGIMVSINQRLDAETINLVAEEFGFKTEYISAEVAQAIVEEADAEEDLQPRAPIVTVMGHVDHGKTSLLDYIRKSNVIAGEAGGITQHIGAYHVTLDDGREITFLDTPGHEAFTAMRARGAKVTDVVIVIVAADDNVMPQTKEAINHAMAAGVPIVFAINKIDKPGANPDKIKEELANMNFLVEEWGGKYQSQDISAKKGIGVHELLEKVLLEAEMLDLKANPNRRATGSIIESSLDKETGRAVRTCPYLGPERCACCR